MALQTIPAIEALTWPAKMPLGKHPGMGDLGLPSGWRRSAERFLDWETMDGTELEHDVGRRGSLFHSMEAFQTSGRPWIFMRAQFNFSTPLDKALLTHRRSVAIDALGELLSPMRSCVSKETL